MDRAVWVALVPEVTAGELTVSDTATRALATRALASAWARGPPQRRCLALGALAARSSSTSTLGLGLGYDRHCDS